MPDGPLPVILSWIQNPNDHSEECSLRYPIHGLKNHDQAQLSRLGAMVREDIEGFAPTSLTDALESTCPLSVPPAVRDAFNKLLKTETENTTSTEDAVVSLARLYAAIVKPIDRRPLGTFFTPKQYAMSIVTGLAERYAAPTEIVDVGAGVGVFSQAARSIWPDVTIHAIDINPLTLGLQGSAMKRGNWRDVHLELNDYPSWLLGRDSAKITGPTLYLGNPPYTRWQLLDQENRHHLVAATSGLVGSRANLSTLFLGMTLVRLRPVDSLAMIIPASWMRADYGANLREWLRSQQARPIRLRLADSWRFEEATVNTVLVEVGPETSSPREIQVSDWAGSETLEVDRRDAKDEFPTPGWDNLHVTSIHSHDERLGRLAHVTRGTASGANTFFIKPHDDWERLGVPSQFRRPLARRLRPGDNPNTPQLERAEILVLGDYTLGDDEQVDSLIRTAEEAGYNRRHLCAQRARWFDLSSEIKTPDVILSALARNTFHVAENVDRLAITNNLFGMYWLSHCTEKKKRDLLRWLRSPSGQRVLRACASVEAHGLYRLSPTTVEAIALDNLTSAEASVSPLVAGWSYEHV